MLDLTISDDSDNEHTPQQGSSAAPPYSSSAGALQPRGVFWGGEGLSSSSGSEGKRVPLLKDKLDKEQKKPSKLGKKAQERMAKADSKLSASERRLKEEKKAAAELRKANSGPIVKRAKKSLTNKQESVFSARILPFAPTKPADLEWPNGKIRSTRPQRQKPRKERKKKGKKRAGSDSDEESSDGEPRGALAITSDSEDDFDDIRRFSLTNVAGSSFDKTGAPLRGIISSPSMQLPWAWGRFDWPKASYKGDMPLLLLHKEPLTHPGGFDSYGGVLTHVPERADGSARLNARFWMTLRHDTQKRVFLRLAICSTTADRSWDKLESIVWMQDFPQQTSPPGGIFPTGDAAVFNNPTATPFSKAFLQFLVHDLQLPTTSEYRTFIEPLGTINWTKSATARIVYSLAGTFAGEDEVERAGGLVSLAKAIADLKTFEGGKWEIEYASSHSSSVSKESITKLYNACQGISPLDSTAVGEPFKSSRCKILWPTQLWAENATDHAYLLKEPQLLKYVEASGNRASDDIRSELLHQLDTKSGRIFNGESLVIVHKPPKGFNKAHEAFFVVGSHSLSHGSWGFYRSGATPSVNFKAFELSVVTRVAAGNAEDLDEYISNRVGYERPPERYEGADAPYEEMPEPIKRTKKSDE